MKRVLSFCVTGILFTSLNLAGQDINEQITTELQVHFENSDLPGFCVAIVNENEVLYQEGFGYSNRETGSPFTSKTVLNIGSTSKVVLGAVLVKVIQNKQLTYTSSINEYLPFKVINPHSKETPILIKHLATHTSGITDTKNYGKSYVSADTKMSQTNVHQDFEKFIKSHHKMSLEEFLNNILHPDGEWYKKKNFLKAEPGQVKEYANINAALTGLIIEYATGNSLEASSIEYLFTPLQMSSTTWSLESVAKQQMATRYFPLGQIVPDYSLITYPDGGLYSSVEDLSRFLQELINAFMGKSEILPPPFSNIMLPGDNDDQRIFIGMNPKSKNIGHSGSDPGVQTDLQFNADSKVGRIVVCNVNAEDNEKRYQEYLKIHEIVAKYENLFSKE
ncbi:CubicO group peptidase, beta-lactamase class C family [Robiginitalea myxolifaciens]|uniref:CubicO group peptidase, beta-lactamase class C family n=1 Tax=Robiginitalea myxolifaciens TaxID=400055 RepID=A0A1I6HA99_9FLAO|nr:serine hydrolase domain-containing protein [Robiginitalea myxolifaciens]SFR51435.1 CubicO group peptidase, beta-lactamase class C family [Robiginitalea myxolifaciens]